MQSLMRFHLRSILNLFLVLSWTGGLVYMLLGQIMSSEHHRQRRMSQTDSYDTPRELLQLLGFIGNPQLYPQSYHDEDWPVAVTAVAEDDIDSFYGFVQSFQTYFQQRKLVVYSIGLNEKDKSLIRSVCFCVVRNVHWEKYPPHIADLSNGAFRPILLQEALVEFGGVFWVDPSVRFTSGDLYNTIDKAKNYGLVTWPMKWPTSSLTHYNMFRYFNADWKWFYFHRMADPGRLLIYNTMTTHKQLMLPWIKCVLDLDCLAPIGSQRMGCNFQRKPRYIYTGCHRYSVSAFNVVLGLQFKYETPYFGDRKLLLVENRQKWVKKIDRGVTSSDWDLKRWLPL